MTLPVGSAVVNWLWLAPLPARERVLLVAEPDSSWREWLGRHFRSVEVLSPETFVFPFGPQSFDCVVLPGFIGLTHRPAPSRVVRECRRVLRPGGVLLASGRNPAWHGGAAFGWLADLRFRGELTRSGFASVHAYFADPSDVAPQSIIPARRAASLAYERQEAVHRGLLPRVLALLGLHNFLYPAHLVLAVA